MDQGYVTSKGNRLGDSLANNTANQILFELSVSIGLTTLIVTNLIKVDFLLKFSTKAHSKLSDFGEGANKKMGLSIISSMIAMLSAIKRVTCW